jgi:hypothetical protein
MPLCKPTLVITVLLCASPAYAQADARVYVHGDFGYGSLDDDEGSLGAGRALGVAVGGAIIDEVQAEFSVIRMRHQRSIGISWNGNITSYMGRVLYRGGGPTSTTRWFIGAGAGYYSYDGVVSETIVPSLSSPPVIDRFDYSVRGLAYETGAGVEFTSGLKLFLRPELWVTIPRGERSSGGRTPDPPFLIARGGVVVGLRF